MTTFYIHKGGPDHGRQSAHNGYPRLLPASSQPIWPAAHAKAHTYTERFMWSSIDDNQTAYMKSAPMAVDDIVVLHHLPIGVWLEYFSIYSASSHEGLTFDVMVVDIDDVQAGASRPQLFAPIQEDLIGDASAANIAAATTVITGVDFDIDASVEEERWVGEYVWPRTNAALQKKGKMLVAKITALPIVDMYAKKQCGPNPCIDIRTSLIYSGTGVIGHIDRLNVVR